MRRYSLIVIFILLLQGTSIAGSGTRPLPSVNKIIREMELVRAEIDDLSTLVERVTVDPATGRKRSAVVSLKYKKPDKLRTEVAGKDARRVTINGKEMWIYSPGLKMAEEYRLDTEEKLLIAIYQNSWGLTSPIKALVRGMNRSVRRGEEGELLIELTPDRKESPIDKIMVWVTPGSWLIRKMKIFQPGRPPVTLTVKEWQVNSGLSSQLFDFHPPPGVDIFQPLQPGEGSFQ